MKLAIISDIHGNAFALDTALAQIEQQQVDQIVCLGDVAVFGPQPHETVQRIQALGCPVVMGNTDDWILNDYPGTTPDHLSESETIFHWGASMLTPDDIDFLRTFQPTLEITLGPKTILCYHGSPRSSREAILATTPDSDLDTVYANSTAPILIGGHTHLQMLRRWRERLILNPGSIGIPPTRPFGPDESRSYHPQAEYMLLAWENNALNIEFHQIEYNLTILRNITLASGMPHADWWISKWILHPTD
jgi:putative phosphoesterase